MLSALDVVAQDTANAKMQDTANAKILWGASVNKAFMSRSTWNYANSTSVFWQCPVRHGGGPLRNHSILNT
jgi:hypothetical protein